MHGWIFGAGREILKCFRMRQPADKLIMRDPTAPRPPYDLTDSWPEMGKEVDRGRKTMPDQLGPAVMNIHTHWAAFVRRVSQAPYKVTPIALAKINRPARFRCGYCIT